MNVAIVEPAVRPPGAEVPLCVDLDGTLVRTDTLAESVILLAAGMPWRLLWLPFWLLRGRAYLKEQLARLVVPDPATLPYHGPLLEMLRASHQAGRRVILATAAHERIAQSVASHLQCFSGVVATTATVNLKGATKATALVTQYGAKQFDYVGDSAADLPVWRQCREIHLAEGNASLERTLGAEGLSVARVWGPARKGTLRQLPRIMRLHQWLKNLLIFAPLVASLSVFDPVRVGRAVLACVLFGLCASSIYIVNDLLDLAADRQHRRKRARPFASGDSSILTGAVLAPGFALSALVCSAVVMPKPFTVALLVYLAMTLAYSFYVKRVVIADAVMLAALYTIRIIAGALAIEVVLSFWLLAFSMFLFLSLALMKRFTEVRESVGAGHIWIAGRSYIGEDLRLLGGLGTSAGYCAVLVLALYINSPEVVRHYKSPAVLWLLCPLLLYWLGRFWLQTERGNMHDDPVVFAAKDRVTHIVGVFGAMVLGVAATMSLAIQ